MATDILVTYFEDCKAIQCYVEDAAIAYNDGDLDGAIKALYAVVNPINNLEQKISQCRRQIIKERNERRH